MVLVTADIPDGATLEQEVDRDIDKFERFFCDQVDPSTPKLSGPERAIIKTYLHFKTHPTEVPSGQESSRRDPV